MHHTSFHRLSILRTWDPHRYYHHHHNPHVICFHHHNPHVNCLHRPTACRPRVQHSYLHLICLYDHHHHSLQLCCVTGRINICPLMHSPSLAFLKEERK